MKQPNSIEKSIENVPKSSILCDRRASNVCKLQLSASIPLASVLRKCISYSSKSRDVGDVAWLLLEPPDTEPGPAEPPDSGGGGAGISMSELPLLELGVVA